MAARIDDPALPVDGDSVIVLKHAGPLGAPGMPEWGQLPIPKKLLEQGVRDMLRISDARMSGTSYGACVLHVAPESYVGGPLALVRDGDMITLDVAARRLQLDVDDAELARRRERVAPARAAFRARLRRALPEPHQPGERRAATSISSRARRPTRRARDPLEPAPKPPADPGMRALQPAARRVRDATMQRAGSSADEAATIARRLVDANCVGHDSHGVIRVGKYLEWVRAGWLCPISRRRSSFESDAIAIVDGNRGFGQVIGEFATRLGIAKAAKSGIAMIGLRNCGHLGRVGDWAEMAAAEGQVSLHFLNTSGAQRVAPFGGSDRRLSTNPISYRHSGR